MEVSKFSFSEWKLDCLKTFALKMLPYTNGDLIVFRFGRLMEELAQEENYSNWLDYVNCYQPWEITVAEFKNAVVNSVIENKSFAFTQEWYIIVDLMNELSNFISDLDNN